MLRIASPSDLRALAAALLTLVLLGATGGAVAASASSAHAASKSEAVAVPTPGGSVFLEELTSTELAARIAAGSTTVLIPIGGIEQNGAHIALGKHNARVRVLAGRIAGVLGNTIVAPVVAYVPEGSIEPASGHMRHPGTLSVPDTAFRQVLEGAARSLRHHGFRDIVLLGDHGGYQADLRAVASRLDRTWAQSGVRVHALPEYYRASSQGFDAWLREHGFGDGEIGIHAGLADTALTLALVPGMVRGDRLADAGRVPGVRGDPRRATAALGEAGAALIVTRTVAAIRAAIRR